MADVTDARVIKFVNDFIRPHAERLRNLDVFNEDGKDGYFAQISALIASNAGTDKILDGRDAEGISRLTVDDVKNFITQVGTISTFFGNTGVRDVIRKPTVRPLQNVS